MGRGQEAYDFQRYEAPLTRKTPVVNQPPELRVTKTRRDTGFHYWAQPAGIFLSVLVLFSAVVYNQMLMSELTSVLEGVQAEYDGLKDDYHRMEVELDGKMSLRSIEDSARSDLGMSKIEDYQVKYINLGGESNVIYSRQNVKTEKTFVEKIYDPIVEYFAG